MAEKTAASDIRPVKEVFYSKKDRVGGFKKEKKMVEMDSYGIVGSYALFCGRMRKPDGRNRRSRLRNRKCCRSRGRRGRRG